MRRIGRIVSVLMGFATAGTAQAACDTANQYRFSFANQPAQGLSYNSSYNYTAANGLGGSQPLVVNITQNGLSSTVVANQVMPRIANTFTGSTVQNTLTLGGVFSGRTSNITSGTRVIRATFTFSQPVRDLETTLFDIDFATNQFRDWVHVVGIDAQGNNYTPLMISPAGNGNQLGQPVTSAASSVRFQQDGVNARQATGNGASANSSDTGTINISFAQPVTSLTFSYGNAPLLNGESATGQQAVGISGIAYCPMPQIAVSKTSSAVIGSLGTYNLPDNEVIYTLTVTNSGGSPVDAASLLLFDQLPVEIEFRNQPFDGTTSLPVKVFAAGGTSLSTSGLSYQSRGGTAYNPISGFDPQVGGLRIVPQGELAANATLTLQFRARIR